MAQSCFDLALTKFAEEAKYGVQLKLLSIRENYLNQVDRSRWISAAFAPKALLSQNAQAYASYPVRHS
jgi:hypothetical protein